MSLRTRAIRVFLTASALSLLVFVVVSDQIVGRGFAELEAADASERIDRALDALISDLERQSIATRDVAMSPDATEVLRGRRSIMSERYDSVDATPEFDVMLILDPFGEVVYSAGPVGSLPEGATELLRENHLRLPAPRSQQVTGIGSTGDELLSVVAYQVPGHRTPLGTVLTADVLTERDVSELQDRAFIDIGLAPVADRTGFAATQFSTGRFEASDLETVDRDGVLTATVLLLDPVGRFVLEVSSPIPKKIVAAGRAASEQLILVIVLTTALVMLVTSVWFERSILGRLARLTALVARSDEPDRETIEIPGGDELTVLAERMEATLRNVESARRELEASNRELAVANELKDEFVSMVSHEFRTPLTSIQGYTETMLLHSERLSSDQRQVFIDKVLKQSRRLNRMVDDLLTLSQARKGTMHLEPEDLAVEAMVREAVEAIDGGSGVRQEIPADLVVHADRDHVQRILTNFLENALKYGAAPITVGARAEGELVSIAVADHGPGVPEEFREQLFDRFTQASVGTQRTAKGVGLGLSIVRTLAEENHGEVWYEPNEPGSVFGVRLPVGAYPTRVEEARSSMVQRLRAR